MERQSSARRGAGSDARPRRDAFVTIERRLGAPRLFATAYSTVGSSIYFALGVVAAYALGLTPLVLLLAGLLFIMTTITSIIMTTRSIAPVMTPISARSA